MRLLLGPMEQDVLHASSGDGFTGSKSTASNNVYNARYMRI